MEQNFMYIFFQSSFTKINFSSINAALSNSDEKSSLFFFKLWKQMNSLENRCLKLALQYTVRLKSNKGNLAYRPVFLPPFTSLTNKNQDISNLLDYR